MLEPVSDLATRSDSALVDLARAGDRSALAVLFARVAPSVFAHARERGATPTVAAAVTRDAFLEAARQLDSDAAASPRAWIAGMAGDELATPGRRHRLGSASRAALAAHGGALGQTALDALWREIDIALGVPGAPRGPSRRTLVLAAVVLGLVVIVGAEAMALRDLLGPSEPVAPAPLEAQPVPDPVVAADDAEPAALPTVIAPPAPAVETAEPTPEPTSQPSPQPSPQPSVEPSPQPTGTETTTEATPSPTPTDQPPQAAIEQPADGQNVTATDNDADGNWAGVVDLLGTASDDLDGPEALRVTWTSDRDGQLATTLEARGVPLSHDNTCDSPTGVASPTQHVVTLTVVDSAGQVATDSVAVTVRCPVVP